MASLGSPKRLAQFIHSETLTSASSIGGVTCCPLGASFLVGGSAEAFCDLLQLCLARRGDEPGVTPVSFCLSRLAEACSNQNAHPAVRWRVMWPSGIILWYGDMWESSDGAAS